MADVVILNPRYRRVERPKEEPMDLACHAVELAAADFMAAILDANSVDEALRLHRRIEALIEVLNAVSLSSLDKANSF